ncbi:MAG: Na/Pi cotransporter family protein [Candidatus Izemoplasmatales bacterium]|nr:Na/Pi cotransporter family protein [Candidatus Izemoplasmatales bacterium]MDD4069923.1 Na/Pi cotransporter family protein [Candidatus Izemoplasmatales bacterium]
MPIRFLEISGWTETAFLIVGGLGIFLYGINLMSDALKKLAGSKLKLFLEKTTNTPLKGIFVGILLTALIQSSSATSALVVGLVRAGLMTLPQAVGVIFGANIGTTFTSVLISLDIGSYAMPIMFLGAILIFFFKRKKVQQLGRVIFGFGMLFFGLDTMGGALKTLAELPQFASMLHSVGDTPILGVIVGVLTTAIIQSSSATIGILQQLYSTGGMTLIGATAIVLGDNIGTTVTSIMASVGGTSSAKRTALIHVLFNTFGTVVFFILLKPYTEFITWLSNIIGIDPTIDKFTISLAHVCFNIMTVLILFWFVKQMVWLVSKIIPSKDEIEMDEVVLDKLLLKSSPDLALENVKKAMMNMANVTRGMLEFSYNYAFENDDKAIELGNQCEEMLDSMDDKIHNYLVDIGANDLSEAQIQRVAKNIDTITDLERIGDHFDNLFEFFQERKEKKLTMHKKTKEELLNLFSIIRSQLEKSTRAYFEDNLAVAIEVTKTEEELDRLVKEYRKNHINRINDRSCEEINAGFYVDILSNIERIGDHCNNMAINVINKDFSYHHDDYEHL